MTVSPALIEHYGRLYRAMPLWWRIKNQLLWRLSHLKCAFFGGWSAEFRWFGAMVQDLCFRDCPTRERRGDEWGIDLGNLERVLTSHVELTGQMNAACVRYEYLCWALSKLDKPHAKKLLSVLGPDAPPLKCPEHGTPCSECAREADHLLPEPLCGKHFRMWLSEWEVGE